MSLNTTTGLIIKEQKVGENDRLATILTSDLGLIRAFVPGAMKLKSKNIAATSLLSFSDLEIYQSRDTYKVNSARSREIFFGLRNDIASLSLAGYFCELLINLAPVFEPAEEYLKLTLNCLYLLCENKKSKEFIKAVFELKIAEYSGYCPDLIACAKCKEEKIENVGFDTLNGVVYCENCKNDNHISLPNSVFAAMRHIIYSDDKKVFCFKINEQSEQLLAQISENFIISQTEKNYKTLEFYKQMRN
ncbi:MAG: DNA repair protein RecO [Clostridia bacterium]|nr:DNA repair protein RecO [Clostridia bacterium]